MRTLIRFWLLDVNSEGSEIRLWGIDGEGKRALVLDRSFLPRFYLVLREGFGAETVMNLAASLRKPEIQNLEVVDRKYFGRPVKVIKVSCKDPESLGKCARELSKMEGVKDTLEDDLRLSQQYLMESQASPCSWHEIEVEETRRDSGLLVDRVYVSKSPPKISREDSRVELRVLSLSLTCHSKMGSPKPERDPVIVISTYTNTGEDRQFLAKDLDDREALRAFVEYIRTFDPDIIVGYNSNREAWPYLLERARRQGVPLKVNRSDSEPHASLYGHTSVTGRANVDLHYYAEEFAEVKIKTLDNVATFLGVKASNGSPSIEDIDIPKYWDDSAKRPQLVKRSLDSARRTLGVAQATLDFTIQLASLVGLPLDQVGAAAVGFRVENFMIRHAHRLNELIPKRVERPYFPYAGAIVLEPKAGIHENVVVLDFKSMYPNLMINKNISPDTYCPPGEPDPPSGVNVAPEVGHRFRKDPPGFYKQILSYLIEARATIKDEMEGLQPRSFDYRILDARQKAIKVIANACYGYAGWIGARWYSKPVAEATTAWGRDAILQAMRIVKKLNLQLIYGDTDSLFVVNDRRKVEALCSFIEEELDLEARPNRIYSRVLFTEAKKRYAGLVADGRLEVVGLEVVRGDWTEVAKDVQEKVLDTILREISPEKAVRLVKKYIEELQGGSIPYSKLIIWKTLTKKIDEYEMRAPHVEVAKTLKEHGLELTLGDKVGYVITEGEGKLWERAKPYFLSSYEEVDIDYYVNNQVIPAALRILALFGVREDDLRPEQPSLTKFLN